MSETKNTPENQKADIKTSLVQKGRKTPWHLQKMKDEGQKIVMVGTAYNDPLFSMFCEMAGVDVVRYTAPGENTEHRAQNLAWWTRDIRKMAPTVHLNAYIQTQRVADKYSALREASIIQADGADSVNIMGITNDTLKYLTDNHISVFGHVGVLSGWQTGKFGGYKKVGKTADDAMEIFRQAYEYQENGMCGMTIENTPREVTNAIAKKLRIPVIGIAAGGGEGDGSELVHFDIFGMMPPNKVGKHAKKYGELIKFCVGAYKAFADEVREGEYPEESMAFPMDEAEHDKFMNDLEHFGSL
jgi:3-methyl-2-oxobutanoate hydroxymethyltransferase